MLRIVAAFIFIPSGTMKLFGFPAGMPPDGSTAPLMSQIGIGGLLEVVGGALLLVGLFTRPVAFILFRDDGGRLFPVPPATGLLARDEWGHTGHPLLFRLAVFFGRWRRPVEPGRQAWPRLIPR
ncbi:MAG TPA: DoxX family protein [Vicinamibacterales bacterium]|nr:DoxX family protein [Vicinamibacterales bacterium]